MRQFLHDLVESALGHLRDEGHFVLDSMPPILLERGRDARHGDFATPVALGLARVLRQKPRKIAERIVAGLPDVAEVARVEVAGPGFINFHLSEAALRNVVSEVAAAGEAYGRSRLGGGRRIQVEFVSSNPTGPLHVGHGRNAAYGAALANLLEAAGFHVQREYYVNDVGRQMDTLALSVWLRYLERRGERVAFPAKGYQGDYLHGIAAALSAARGGRLRGHGARRDRGGGAAGWRRRRGGALPRRLDRPGPGTARRGALPGALRGRVRLDGRRDEGRSRRVRGRLRPLVLGGRD